MANFRKRLTQAFHNFFWVCPFSEVVVKLNKRELREILLHVKIDLERYHKGQTHYMGKRAHDQLVEKLEGKLETLRGAQ